VIFVTAEARGKDKGTIYLSLCYINLTAVNNTNKNVYMFIYCHSLSYITITSTTM